MSDPSSIKALERKLLSLGGQQFPRPEGFAEPDLDLILTTGQLWKSWRVRRFAGVMHRCHANASVYYLEDRHFGPGRMQIATGYALAGGMWHQHSWLWDGRHIWEGTDRRELYFGAILEGERLTRFVFGTLIASKLLPWRRGSAHE